MVPNRTLPIVGYPTLSTGGRRPARNARPRSILKRLANALTPHRHLPDPRDVAYFERLDRDIDLIEHQTCDCL